MNTTQRERLMLAYKILITRPSDCPVRQLVAELVAQLAQAKKAELAVRVLTRAPPTQMLVVNIHARQAAVFGGSIQNN